MKLRLQNTNGSLKDILTAKGLYFPCGGKGICGRCRILAPDLPPTEPDRRFFSESDIQRGMRLACDKTIEKDIEIEHYLPLAPKAARVDYPQIAAVIRREGIELALVGDYEIERIFLPPPEISLLDLRAAVGKNSVDFFEKYKVAKAENILVAGESDLVEIFAGKNPPVKKGEIFPASFFDMPSETVYIPPSPQKAVGSDALLELLDAEENSLTILQGQGLFLFKGESVLTASIGAANGKLWERALVAGARYFTECLGANKVILIGSGAYETLLKRFGIRVNTKLSSAISAAVLTLTDNRYRTRLDKLAGRTEFIDLAEAEEWHRFFSE